MHHIMIVDDMAVVRLPIAAALEAAGYGTICVSSGEQAIYLLGQQPRPALVLLDLTMPGMGGLAALKAMRKLPAAKTLPVILLTASGERDVILQAAKLGVRDYILKSRLNFADLLARVGKNLAAADPATADAPSAPPTPASIAMNRDQTLARLAKAEIQPFPGSVTALLSVLESGDGTMIDAANSLKQDPVLSSAVIRMANSAAFKVARGRITSIEDAVKHIGLSEVRRLATSIGVMTTVSGNRRDIDALRMWNRSLTVATLMERVAASTGRSSRDAAYAVGICYMLPEILLRQQFAPECARADERSRQTGRPWRAAAQDVFGMPFSQLAQSLFERLQLPLQLSAPICEFYRSSHAAKIADPLAGLLCAAAAYAHGMMPDPDLQSPIVPLPAGYVGLPAEGLTDTDPAKIRLEALRAIAAVGGFSESDINAAKQSPLARRPIRLAYLRGPGLSAFDPMLNFLQLVVEEVVLFEEIPSFDELSAGGIQAIAAATTGGHADDRIAAELLDQFSSVRGQSPVPLLWMVDGEMPPKAKLTLQAELQPLPVAPIALLAFVDRLLTNIPAQAA